MRAKMLVQSVEMFQHLNRVKMTAVCSKGFGPKGESEDNTYARHTPSGQITLDITNPDLLGKLAPGQKFYVDFTEAAE